MTTARARAILAIVNSFTSFMEGVEPPQGRSAGTGGLFWLAPGSGGKSDSVRVATVLGLFPGPSAGLVVAPRPGEGAGAVGGVVAAGGVEGPGCEVGGTVPTSEVLLPGRSDSGRSRGGAPVYVPGIMELPGP